MGKNDFDMAIARAQAFLLKLLNARIIRFISVITTFVLAGFTTYDPTILRIITATIYAIFNLIVIKWCFDLEPKTGNKDSGAGTSVT